MDRVKGKVALITGAGKGQGRTHAVRLAEEGADLVLLDICAQIDSVEYELAKEGDLAQTASEVEALGRRVVTGVADVRDQEALDAVVAAGIDELGKIDLLVANAGIWTPGRFWELTDEQWNDSIAVNLTAVWRTVKAVTPHMIERGQGAMVLVGSSNAYEGGTLCAHYTAAKHGVVGLMRSIALELAPYGIRCNVVSPGAMDTDMLRFQQVYDMMGGHPGSTPRRRGDRHTTGRFYRTRDCSIRPRAQARQSCGCSPTRPRLSPGRCFRSTVGTILPGLNPNPVI